MSVEDVRRSAFPYTSACRYSLSLLKIDFQAHILKHLFIGCIETRQFANFNM